MHRVFFRQPLVGEPFGLFTRQVGSVRCALLKAATCFQSSSTELFTNNDLKHPLKAVTREGKMESLPSGMPSLDAEKRRGRRQGVGSAARESRLRAIPL